MWNFMEAHKLVPYPLPLKGRIPNFVGNKDAAYKLCATKEFRSAKVVKIHPSLNAQSLRFLALKFGKTVLTPPLPGHNFLYFMLDSSKIPANQFKYAASKKGFNSLGVPVSLEDIPMVDLVVVATVACTGKGARLGKGKGYGEVEYGILREMGKCSDSTPVATIVHDCQIVPCKELPGSVLAEHDLPVDIIATPTGVTRTHSTWRKPQGIIWDLITEQMKEDIGALKDLKKIKDKANLNADTDVS